MAVIVVRELEKVVKATSLALYGDETTINFISGDGNMILKMLTDIPKNVRYPLITIEQPFNEYTGTGYLNVRIPRLIIATITDSTNPVLERYNETFEPILYKIYEELFNQMSRFKGIVQDNKHKIKCRKQDVPGSIPTVADSKDYWDTIELYDLELDFKEAGRIC